MNSMKKGSIWEREICKQLSLWWSDNKRDDIFWRSTTSGARATVRSRQGKNTFGQYGDIQATDPIGQTLLDVCTMELKRGYSKDTIAHILDAPKKSAVQAYAKFINQAITDHKKAKSLFWMLIVKRDRREPIVYIPMKFYRQICLKSNVHLSSKFPLVLILKYNKQRIFACPLKDFLKNVNPKLIKKIKRHSK